MMDKIIIEKMKSCSLVGRESEENGHDCWGKIEWTSHDIVRINGTKERVYEGEYIVHDGKEVLATGYINRLPDKLRALLDPAWPTKEKERKKQQYLELKQEFENE